jgi:hypothetical protein
MTPGKLLMTILPRSSDTKQNKLNPENMNTPNTASHGNKRENLTTLNANTEHMQQHNANLRKNVQQ